MPLACTSSVLCLPVGVEACMNVRGDCFKVKLWLGVEALPLPRTSLTDWP